MTGGGPKQVKSSSPGGPGYGPRVIVRPLRGQATVGIIGLDIGTSNCKCVVFDAQGEALAAASAGYDLTTDDTGRAELDPDAVFDSLGRSVRDALAASPLVSSEVQALSFSAAMHSLMAVDARGEPLTPLSTFADTRASPHTRRIREAGGLEIYRRTGTPLHPMAPLSKIPWLAEASPDAFAKTALFVGIKEWVLWRLCGRWVVDHSIASATGLFDIHRLAWDSEALAAAGIASDRLPEPVSTTSVIGKLSDPGAGHLSLPAGLPLVAGASDGCLANLGAGAISPGATALTIGTSGAIRTVLPEPHTDPQGRVFCYALTEDHWVVGGPVSNGGLVLQWVADLVARKDIEESDRQSAFDLLVHEASEIEPGAGGLLLLPYLVGERAPHWDADARGALVGLRLHHTRAHLTRAALEGVLFGLKSVATVVEDMATLRGPLRATGGFLQSPLWFQMLADIFGREVEVPADEDASPLGAAILGMVAVGMADSIEVADDMVKVARTARPDERVTARYDPVFQRYLRLYGALEDTYDKADPQRQGGDA